MIKLKIEMTAMLLCLLMLVACVKKGDDESPVIYLDPVQTAGEDWTFFANEQLSITGSVSDNEALSQVRIEVHENFDLHDHGKRAAPFYWVEIVNTGGTQDNFSVDTLIPSGMLAGPYHLEVQATDQNGNESEVLVANLRGLHPEQARISVREPIFNGDNSLDWPKGDTLNFDVMITDSLDLEELKIEIRAEVSAGAKSFSYLQEEDLSGNSDLSFNWKQSLVIGPEQNSGIYYFVVWAKNKEGHISYAEYILDVSH